MPEVYNIINEIPPEVLGVLIYLLIFAVIFLILWIIRLIIKSVFNRGKHVRHAIFLVRLPKENPGEEKKDFSIQEIREEIAKGETVFAAIGGPRAQRGFMAWLLGRDDHYAFEIVATDKKISFYAIAPKQMARYLEQQINAHYPDALVEEVPDYNIFSPQGIVVGGYTKTTRSFILPLKTYQKLETDTMNSVLNVMSKLDEGEGMAIQYVVRSAKAGWHKKSSDIVGKVHEGKTLAEVMHTNVGGRVSKGVWEFFKIVGSSATNKKEKMQEDIEKPHKLSAMEEEMLKGIEEKNSKSGLDVNLRIIVSVKEKAKADIYLNNLSSAFSQYNYYVYGNSFIKKIAKRKNKKVVSDFIFRRFNEKISFLLNSEELASLYHFPLKDCDTPNILWLTAKQAPAPSDVPEEGIFLGHNFYRGIEKPIHMLAPDRLRHFYIVGKSGVGKSEFIGNLAVQDILNGEGICVLDPHGDLVESVLERVPPERAEDVIVFAPADTQRPLGLNLLEYDPKYPEQKTFVINEMIGIFDKLYDLKQTGGPIFEQYMRNALLLIMDDPETGSTLMEVPKVLSDPDFRKMKLDRCHNSIVVDFWRKEAEKAGGDAALANVVPYITSKLTQFVSNDMMRPIIAQQFSAFNFREAMDSHKIILIDLPKGTVGEMNAYLLGMVIVGKILMAALSRTDLPKEKRNPFYLYIDEFQNFTTDSVCQILSEARKYALGLILSHQYVGQLVINNNTKIKDAVFGNVGTIGAFRIGSEDAEFLEKEFSPVFNQFDLINVDKFSMNLKLLVKNTALRPFTLRCPWPNLGVVREGMSQKIRALSRLKYGQDKALIEAQLRRRVKFDDILEKEEESKKSDKSFLFD